jgi:hypothetical protein
MRWWRGKEVGARLEIVVRIASRETRDPRPGNGEGLPHGRRERRENNGNRAGGTPALRTAKAGGLKTAATRAD